MKLMKTLTACSALLWLAAPVAAQHERSKHEQAKHEQAKHEQAKHEQAKHEQIHEWLEHAQKALEHVVIQLGLDKGDSLSDRFQATIHLKLAEMGAKQRKDVAELVRKLHGLEQLKKLGYLKLLVPGSGAKRVDGTRRKKVERVRATKAKARPERAKRQLRIVRERKDDRGNDDLRSEIRALRREVRELRRMMESLRRRARLH